MNKVTMTKHQTIECAKRFSVFSNYRDMLSNFIERDDILYDLNNITIRGYFSEFTKYSDDFYKFMKHDLIENESIKGKELSFFKIDFQKGILEYELDSNKKYSILKFAINSLNISERNKSLLITMVGDIYEK